MSRKICWIMMFLLAGLVLSTACQKQETIGINAEMNGVPYHVVSVAELQTMLENKDFFMVNVHIPWQGDIPQTDLRLSYAEIEQNLDQLPDRQGVQIIGILPDFRHGKEGGCHMDRSRLYQCVDAGWWHHRMGGSRTSFE